MTDIDVEALLEQRGLSQLLQEFVCDCAEQLPEDLTLHMARWAAGRRGLILQAPSDHSDEDRGRATPMGSSSSLGKPLQSWMATESRSASAGGSQAFHSLSNLAPGLAARRKARGITAVVMSTTETNKQPLVELLESQRCQKPTTEASTYFSFVKSRVDFHNLRNVAVLPIEWEACGPLVVLDHPQSALEIPLIALASISDVVILVFSCRTALQDLAKKRLGEMYNRVLLAHGLSVRKMILIMTDTKGMSAANLHNVEVAVSTMMSKCGFGDTSRYRLMRTPEVADRILQEIASFPPSRRTVSEPETATRFRAHLMILSPQGLNVGERISFFSTEMLKCRIDSVIFNGQTTTVVPQHSFGRLSLSILGAPPVGRIALKAPIVAFREGLVLALGEVIDVDALEEEDVEEEEFQIETAQ